MSDLLTITFESGNRKIALTVPNGINSEDLLRDLGGMMVAWGYQQGTVDEAMGILSEKWTVGE